MCLEMMHHLKFVFDITEEQIGRRQRIDCLAYARSRFTRAAASRNASESVELEEASRPVDCACGVDR